MGVAGFHLVIWPGLSHCPVIQMELSEVMGVHQIIQVMDEDDFALKPMVGRPHFGNPPNTFTLHAIPQDYTPERHAEKVRNSRRL